MVKVIARSARRESDEITRHCRPRKIAINYLRMPATTAQYIYARMHIRGDLYSYGYVLTSRDNRTARTNDDNYLIADRQQKKKYQNYYNGGDVDDDDNNNNNIHARARSTVCACMVYVSTASERSCTSATAIVPPRPSRRHRRRRARFPIPSNDRQISGPADRVGKRPPPYNNNR